MEKHMSTLSPPSFAPPVVNGVLCRQHITQNEILVIIPPYPGASYGDRLELYWNNEFIDYNVIQSIPFPGWVVSVPESRVINGINNIYYVSTDILGNRSHSDIIPILVTQVCGTTLPPPIFTDAISDVIPESSIIINQGTRVFIPPYNQIAINDVITVFFLGEDRNNEIIQSSEYQYNSPPLTGNDLNGFTILIPFIPVSSIGNGIARIYYQVTRATSQIVEYSDTAQATINMISAQLTPPIFDDAKHAWLDAQAVSDGIKVSVKLAPEIDITINDIVTLNWYAHDFHGQPISGTAGSSIHTPVTLADIVSGALHFTISNSITAIASIMWLTCEYTVVNQSTNKYRRSYPSTVLIDILNRTLPAPLFPYTENNTLTHESIISNNGTLLRASYPGMMVGDIVYFNIQGRDSIGNIIPEANYNTSTIISIGNIISNSIDITIPSSTLLSVGNNGYITGEYSILFSTFPGGFASSLQKSIIILQNIVPTLILTSTVINDNAEANGIDQNIIIYTLKNSFGQPVEGILTFTRSGTTAILDPAFLASTNSAGQLIQRVTNTISGSVTVTTNVYNNTSISDIATIHFTEKDIVLIAETIRDNSLANGQSSNQILFTLKDRRTNIGIPNVILDIQNNYGAKPESWAPITDLNGHVLLELTSTQAIGVIVSARTLDNRASVNHYVTFI